MKLLLVALGILSLVGVVYMGGDSRESLQHERITTISNGEAVVIENHLGTGFTVIDFGADW